MAWRKGMPAHQVRDLYHLHLKKKIKPQPHQSTTWRWWRWRQWTGWNLRNGCPKHGGCVPPSLTPPEVVFESHPVEGDSSWGGCGRTIRPSTHRTRLEWDCSGGWIGRGSEAAFNSSCCSWNNLVRWSLLLALLLAEGHLGTSLLLCRRRVFESLDHPIGQVELIDHLDDCTVASLDLGHIALLRLLEFEVLRS